MRARTSNRDNELVQFFLREQEGEIPLQNTSEMKQKRFTKVTESYLKTETSTFFFFAQWQPFRMKYGTSLCSAVRCKPGTLELHRKRLKFQQELKKFPYS